MGRGLLSGDLDEGMKSDVGTEVDEADRRHPQGAH